MKRTCRKILVALLAAVLLAAGCGSDDEDEDDTPMVEYKVLGGRLVWCAGTIESITVPDNASSIGNNAFKDCALLTKVVIPLSVTKIGTGTFFGVAVTEIEYKGSMAAWDTLLAESGIAAAGFPAKITVKCTDGIWKPKPAAPATGDDPKPDEPDDQDGWQIEGGVLIKYFGSAAVVTIPENVTAIGEGAFAGCASITHVTMPGGVTAIGADAFKDCTSLAGIDIPDGMTSIGENAFEGCTSLTNIEIPASVETIGAGAIPAGTAVTYHGTAERWDELAEGGGLDGVTVFIVDEGGTLTGYRGSAADITVPESVKGIAGGVFAGHTELEHIVIPAGVTDIAAGAFGGSGITAIEYRGESSAWNELVEASGIAGELAGITVTCADGSWTPAHTHDWSGTYADGGDGTHHRTCAGCGERSTAEEHAYGGTPQADGDDGHYQTCAAAGCGARSATEAHQYAYTGSDANSHTMTCPTCAHTKTEPHDWGSETSTGAGHGKTCAGCGYSETALHDWGETYTDGGADGHYRTCTTAGCGAHSATVAHEFGGVTHTSAGGHYQLCTAAGCGARSPFEEHTYGGTPQADGDDGHYQSCTLAGCEARSATEAHNYTYADSDADNHTMTCADCAHTKSETHAYGGETCTDAGHAKTCSRCGRSETALHDWGAYEDDGNGNHHRTCTAEGYEAHTETSPHECEYKDNADGSHYQSCTARCGYSVSVAHDWGAYSNDGNGYHSRTCTVTGTAHTETEAHTYGTTYTDDKNGKHYQTCTATGCGAQSAAEAHDYGYKDNGDDTHTTTCANCDYAKTDEEHRYENGACVDCKCPRPPTVYAASTGSDSNDGTRTKPFATIQKAVDTVLAQNDGTSAYTIYVDGTLNGTTAAYLGASGMADFSALDKNLTLTIKALSGTATLDGGARFDSNGYTTNAGIEKRIIYAAPASGTLNLTLENLVITGGLVSSDSGGGIYIEGGTVKMKGCTISGNKARYGGGVYFNNGTFTMEGGIISGNTADNSGGGVYNGGTFNLKGGTISECTATIYGGGVYVSSGTFTMSDGEISECTAEGGGGVSINSSGTFTMSGGTISGNTADNSGGGVYNGGTFNLKGGTIGGTTSAEANTAKYGGGVFVASSGTFTMSGGTITGNTASVNGGGIYVNGGTFNLTDGTIGGTTSAEANTAKYGGGVYVSSGTFTMSGGTISGNTASSTGGGVYVNGGNFTPGGTVSGNTPDEVFTAP